MIGKLLEFPTQSKEDAVKIRMDLTIDLPKELADEAERLGLLSEYQALTETLRKL